MLLPVPAELFGVCVNPGSSEAVGGANKEEEETEPREKEKKMSRKEMKKLKKQVRVYNSIQSRSRAFQAGHSFGLTGGSCSNVQKM